MKGYLSIRETSYKWGICKLTHIIDVEKLEIVIKNTEKQTFII